MSKLLPYFVLALLFVSQLTNLHAQSISGSTSVCPNTTYRYTFKGTGCSFTWGNIQGPAAATIVGQGSDYIEVQFPKLVTTTSPFRISAGYACSGTTGTATLDVFQATSVSTNSTNVAVACDATTYTFNYNVYQTEAGTPTWTSNTGWTLVSQTRTQNGGSYAYSSTWTITNYTGGYVKLEVANPTCPAIGTTSITYNISRSQSNFLPHAVFTQAVNQMCLNTSATFAVAPYAGAINYIWSSNDPSVKINGQTSPVTIPASSNGNSVTITAGSNTLSGAVAVVVQTACGNSVMQSAPVFIGNPYISSLGFTNAVGGEGYFCSSHTGNIVNVYPDQGPNITYEARLKTLTGTVVATVSTAIPGTDMFGYRAPGWYIVGVRPKSSLCGSQAWFENEVEYVDCTGEGQQVLFKVSASPNPVTNALTVQTLEEKKEVKALGTNVEVRYILYDFYTSQPVKQWTFKNDQTSRQLNVQGVKPGPYVLQVIKGQYKQSGKIFIR